MQEVESAPSPTIYSSAILAVKTAASEDYGKAIHACVVIQIRHTVTSEHV